MKKFNSQYELLRGAGNTATPQPKLAMRFLYKLHPYRYATTLAQLNFKAVSNVTGTEINRSTGAKLPRCFFAPVFFIFEF
jgi:hypothetical protein